MTLPLAPAFPVPSVSDLNLEILTFEEIQRQQRIIVLREYYEGEQSTKVTSRLLEFMPSLGKGFNFQLNIVSVVIQAVTEHLNVKAWDSDDAELSKWAEGVWEDNNMEARQDDVHESVLVDGEHFVIVGWDNDEDRPQWVPEKAYTSIEVGGTGSGCRMFYPQNNSNLKPTHAIKRWVEFDSDGTMIEFKTVYYPDRIEKFYRRNSVEWLQRTVEGEEWPVPWVDGEGAPLGIPVIRFINKREESEIKDILAVQDAVNKSAIDALISSDQTAFRFYISLGWIPTTDGLPPNDDQSNWATIEPGRIYGTTKSKTEASFNAIEPPIESVEGLSTLTQQFIIWGALTSGTPVTRVVTTKLIASDETLKQQDKPLVNRTALRRSLLGKQWIECMNMSRKLHTLFSNSGDALSDKKVRPVWGSRLHADKAELEALESKQRLGVPQEQIWLEMGYTQAKITQFKSMMQKSQKEAEDAGAEEKGREG